jgi:hypothetical protein
MMFKMLSLPCDHSSSSLLFLGIMKKRQSHLLMIDSTLDLVHRVLFSSQDSAQAAADFDGNIYPFLFVVSCLLIATTIRMQESVG